MNFESLMLIAQLLFFYPGWSGIVQIPCDMSQVERLKGTLGGIFICIFLSMLCHLKYKIVRKKGNIEPVSLGKVEESSFSC